MGADTAIYLTIVVAVITFCLVMVQKS